MRLRFRRLLRLPSFGVALAASLAVLVAFAVWMFVDASFPIALVFVEIDLGLLQNLRFDFSEFHGTFIGLGQISRPLDGPTETVGIGAQ